MVNEPADRNVPVHRRGRCSSRERQYKEGAKRGVLVQYVLK